MKERGFDETLLDSSKLVLLETDTEGEMLGLTQALYEEVGNFRTSFSMTYSVHFKIRDSITLIIHNGTHFPLKPQQT